MSEQKNHCGQRWEYVLVEELPPEGLALKSRRRYRAYWVDRSKYKTRPVGKR